MRVIGVLDFTPKQLVSNGTTVKRCCCGAGNQCGYSERWVLILVVECVSSSQHNIRIIKHPLSLTMVFKHYRSSSTRGFDNGKLSLYMGIYGYRDYFYCCPVSPAALITAIAGLSGALGGIWQINSAENRWYKHAFLLEKRRAYRDASGKRVRNFTHPCLSK
ncbi:hypothetical protein KCP78_08380 [Salmonella enterica subsp. enterica]|nr:hypothetical protein KCP78_08380 [Salmonella enterica subsp. enterica]